MAKAKSVAKVVPFLHSSSKRQLPTSFSALASSYAKVGTPTNTLLSSRNANLSESIPILVTALLISSSITVSMASSKCEQSNDDESLRFTKTLEQYKLHLEEYREKWNWHNTGSRIPTVSWPTNVPTVEEFGGLSIDFAYCQRQKEENDNDSYCKDLKFRIATHLLVQADTLESQTYGLDLIKKLVHDHHPDAICFYAQILNDGKPQLDIESDPARSVSWWKIAADRYSHVPSMYELGVAYYTGEGVEEDDSMAVKWFRKAVSEGEHAGAAFMLGDCLLDGVGVERDRSEALMWLVVAAELGHRGARSRVLALLEFDESKNYGAFTDSSRQTLKKEEGVEETDIQSSRDTSDVIEKRFTIEGNVPMLPNPQRNPVVLTRRRTIVQQSRNHETN